MYIHIWQAGFQRAQHHLKLARLHPATGGTPKPMSSVKHSKRTTIQSHSGGIIDLKMLLLDVYIRRNSGPHVANNPSQSIKFLALHISRSLAAAPNLLIDHRSLPALWQELKCGQEHRHQATCENIIDACALFASLIHSAKQLYSPG